FQERSQDVERGRGDDHRAEPVAAEPRRNARPLPAPARAAPGVPEHAQRAGVGPIFRGKALRSHGALVANPPLVAGLSAPKTTLPFTSFTLRAPSRSFGFREQFGATRLDRGLPFFLDVLMTVLLQSSLAWLERNFAWSNTRQA